MSGKQAKAERQNLMVDISKLRLGLDMGTGRIMLGSPNEAGEIDETAGVVLDITDDFYAMVKEITELRMAAAKIQATKEEPASKIILATDAEKNLIDRRLKS